MGLLEKNTENFSVIPICNNAFEKIKAYARLMDGCECYGFLMSPLEKNDGIVYDAILASDQEVSSSHAKISGAAALNMKEEMNDIGYKPIGFWHSHANFSAFHSGTDDKNLESLLSSFVVNTQETDLIEDRTRIGYFVDDSSIIVRQNGKEYVLKTENNDLSFRVEKQNKPYSELVFGMTKDSEFFLNTGKQTILLKQPANVEIRECRESAKTITGIGYSLVVNNKGERFAEIGKSYLCNSCNHLENEVRTGKVKVVDDGKIVFSEQDLIADIEKRVKNYSVISKGGNTLGKLRNCFR